MGRRGRRRNCRRFLVVSLPCEQPRCLSYTATAFHRALPLYLLNRNIFLSWYTTATHTHVTLAADEYTQRQRALFCAAASTCHSPTNLLPVYRRTWRAPRLGRGGTSRQRYTFWDASEPLLPFAFGARDDCATETAHNGRASRIPRHRARRSLYRRYAMPPSTTAYAGMPSRRRAAVQRTGRLAGSDGHADTSNAALSDSFLKRLRLSATPSTAVRNLIYRITGLRVTLTVPRAFAFKHR